MRRLQIAPLLQELGCHAEGPSGHLYLEEPVRDQKPLYSSQQLCLNESRTDSLRQGFVPA